MKPKKSAQQLELAAYEKRYIYAICVECVHVCRLGEMIVVKWSLLSLHAEGRFDLFTDD